MDNSDISTAIIFVLYAAIIVGTWVAYNWIVATIAIILLATPVALAVMFLVDWLHPAGKVILSDDD